MFQEGDILSVKKAKINSYRLQNRQDIPHNMNYNNNVTEIKKIDPADENIPKTVKNAKKKKLVLEGQVVDLLEFKEYTSCGGLGGECTHSIRGTDKCKNEKCNRIFKDNDDLYKQNYNVQLVFNDKDQGIENLFAWRSDMQKMEANGDTVIEKLRNGVVNEKTFIVHIEEETDIDKLVKIEEKKVNCLTVSLSNCLTV